MFKFIKLNLTLMNLFCNFKLIMVQPNKNKIIILISIFASLTAVGAFIKIPLPYVPITLQTFVVIMSGNLLGARYGAVSQILYLSIGLLGAPIFAYGGGPGYIFQPTFGYLLGYPVCAFFIGVMIKFLLPDFENKKYSDVRFFSSLLISDVIGVLFIFLFGLSYFYLNLKYSFYLNLENSALNIGMDWKTIVKTGFLVFIPMDLIKVALASVFTVKLKRLQIFRLA